MSHRFRFVGDPLDNDTWTVTGDEHTHLAKVLRLALETEVEVTDGKGNWCIGSIKELSSSKAVVSVSVLHFEKEPTVKLIVAVGALGHGEIDEVIAPLVELGVDEIIVFGQDDQAKNRVNDKAIDRWQRMIVGACKQCKRSRYAQLKILKNCDDLISESQNWALKIVGAAEGSNINESLGRSPELKGPVGIVIGSEKGLSNRELHVLTGSSFIPVRIGAHVLRAKTAAVACAAVLSAKINQ